MLTTYFFTRYCQVGNCIIPSYMYEKRKKKVSIIVDSKRHSNTIEQRENFKCFKRMFKIECEAQTIRQLNRNIIKNLILHVNIKSINENFEKLKTLIESLLRKPCDIICTESWDVQNPHFYQLQEYQFCYNKGKIKKADGVLININIYKYF